MSGSKEQQRDEFEYFIVKRRKRKRGGVRPREERPMEVWERAVLDVFSSNEVRGQMLWEAGRIKLDRLKALMVKAEVSNVSQVMDELWLKLAHQSDEAQENRPFAHISAERAARSVEIQKRIDEGYRQMRPQHNEIIETGKVLE